MHGKKPRVCISHTKYEIVKTVSQKLSWPITLSNTDWDILWQDSSVPAKYLASMHSNQKVNHFPGIYEISRKNNLAKNLKQFQNTFPSDYNFFPQSWVLPQDYREVRENLGCGDTFIIKPQAKSQGKGIYLIMEESSLKSTSEFVVQKYIDDPFLINGLKFDFRVYALITSAEPLSVWINTEGLARFATERYEKPDVRNIDNRFMHLTNYAVNKAHPNYAQSSGIFDESSHKRTISSVLQDFKEKGLDAERVWLEICDIVVKTIVCVQPFLASTYRNAQPNDESAAMCFEVLGFDVLIDKNLKPWLLEVNFTPSFSIDSVLDATIKGQLIFDTLRLVHFLSNPMPKIVRSRSFTHSHSSPSKRCDTEGSDHYKPEDILQKTLEKEYRGNLRPVYPAPYQHFYQKFLKFSDRYWKTVFKKSEMYTIPEAKSCKMLKKQEKLEKTHKQRYSPIKIRENSSPTRTKLLSKALQKDKIIVEMQST